MLKRQLKGQLPGGVYYIPEQHLVDECQSVPKTNRISEADFSALDRIDKQAPQKNTAAKSGIINYSNNKTSNFLKQLLKEKKREIF